MSKEWSDYQEHGGKCPLCGGTHGVRFDYSEDEDGQISEDAVVEFDNCMCTQEELDEFRIQQAIAEYENEHG